jgi:hypothetical protein
VPGITLNVGYRTDRQEIRRGRYACIRPSGVAFMEPTQPHSNGSLSGPDDARRLRAAIETLSNLIYLASREAEDPERVRTYLKLAENQVAALGHTLG